ncbi:MAG TPA: uroporphyrinogen-III synthase [Gammaproteobacteria bacterium]|nr:uroporphyrinogen-III synthase [Gammaproteobacteria bacterium]
MTDLDISKPLSTLTFLITRPAQQAHNLCANIETLGGNCIVFSTLEISPLPELQQLLLPILSNLANVDKVIFLSANAVRFVMPYWPDNCKIPPVFAIGPGTAKMLAEFRIKSHTPYANAFNSEGLLSLPELQVVAGQKIVIFSGLDGRMLLENTLKAREARVKQVAVYQRNLPPVDFQAHLSQWQLETIACIISTSSESLNNLWLIAGKEGQAWLRNQQLLVISRSMAELAQKLGFLLAPLIAANASDSAILDTLLASHL